MKPLLAILFFFVCVGFLWLTSHQVFAYTPDDFVMTIDTTLSGETGNDTFQLNLYGGGYNFVIDWGDGATTSAVGSPGNISHTYATSGIKTLVITGEIPRFGWRNSGSYDCYAVSDSAKILTVEQWGTSQWDDMECAFGEAHNVQIPATDAPDLSNVTSMMWMFYNATAFNSDINHWNVSNIENFHRVFEQATSFNQPLDNWDVQRGTNFAFMFRNAPAFNSSLSGWSLGTLNTGVGRVDEMFDGAAAFNQDLSSWDVSNVLDMTNMFHNANSFNQDLSTWDVSNATAMAGVFDDTALSSNNYSNILNAWAALPSLQNNVTLGAADISYLDTATTARQFLIDTYGWTINDAGLYVEPGSQTFITRWDTTLDPSTSNQLSIYTPNSASAFTIDWGDGTTQYFATGPDDFVTHTYSTPGVKTVTITGNFPHFFASCYEGDAYNKLIDVAQWGTGQWESFVESFAGCTYLEDFSATDVPDLSLIVDMSDAFAGASSFNSDLSDWDVSNVIDMSRMFNDAAAFNNDIGAWDVSNVGGMQSMFNGATSFNQDISDWRPSPGDMLALFSGAVNFNSDISAWDVSGVAQLNAIFMGSALSTSNYTKLLLGWSTQVLPDALAPGPIGGTYDADLDDYVDLTPYCTLAQGARDIMTGTYNWSFSDGGPVDCQTATYSAGENGTLTGDTFQYIVDGGSGTAVTAVPAAGYRFTGWSDGSTANPRTDSNLVGSLTVTAVFSSGGGSESTKVGERAKQLAEAIKTMPVVGSVAKFVSSVHDFLMYLTNNEDKLEQLSTEERTVIIVALRDILAFLLRLVPGF